MKKICLITFSNNSDMQRYAYTIGDEIHKKKIDVITITSKKINCNHSMKEYNKVFNVPNRPSIEFKTFNIFELIKIFNIIKKYNNIIFLSSHIWNIFLIYLLRNKKKIIHALHDPIPHSNEKNTRNVFKYNKLLLKKINNIILFNHKLTKETRNLYSFDGNILIMNLWRNWSFFKKTDKKYKKEILFFGRVNPYKGVDYLFQIADRLKNYNINIIGKFSDECIDEKKRLITKKNIFIKDEYVNYNEVENIFNKSAVVILPYKEATQSGIVLDSSYYSKYVIAFDVGGLRDQISNGISGSLIKKNNISLFVNEIKDFLNADLDKINLKNYDSWKYGQQNFSSNIAASNLLEFLEIRSKK